MVKGFRRVGRPEAGKAAGSGAAGHPDMTGAPVVPQPLPLVSYFHPELPQIEARLPVKTSAPISKAKIMDVMAEINRITVHGSICIGDVIMKNIAGTGVDLVSTRTMLIPDTQTRKRGGITGP